MNARAMTQRLRLEIAATLAWCLLAVSVGGCSSKTPNVDSSERSNPETVLAPVEAASEPEAITEKETALVLQGEPSANPTETVVPTERHSPDELNQQDVPTVAKVEPPETPKRSSTYRIWLPTTQGPVVAGLEVWIGDQKLKSAFAEKLDQVIAELTNDEQKPFAWDDLIDHVAKHPEWFGRNAARVTNEKKDLVEKFDRNDNKLVDQVELTKFLYRETRSANELWIAGTDAFRWSNRSQSKLFAMIDLDGNRKLDLAEIDRAGESLVNRVDVNSDGCIDLAEAVDQRMVTESPWGRRRSHRQGEVAMDLVGFVNWSNLSFAISGMFGPSPFFDTGLASALDSDEDRNVTSDEAKRLMELEPSFHIELKFDSDDMSSHRVEIMPSESLAGAVETRQDTKMAWVENSSIAFGVSIHEQSTRAQTIPRLVFEQLDANNDNGIDESEIPAGAEDQIQFELLDKNQDGKLSYREINLNPAQPTSIWSTQVRGRAAECPSGMFAWLDADHDQLLSAREIAAASEKLAVLCGSRETIRASDLPETYLIQFGRGEPEQDENRFQLRRSPQVNAPSRPAWAVKMDSNRDGDISQNEFVGTIAQFSQLDQNQDRFISADELQ